MRTAEVEKLLGMDKETIRFYIRRGLFTPQKDKYGHRDYTDEDIRRLKQILTMRDLGLSVSQIREVLNGDKALSGELEEGIRMLNRQKAITELALGFSRELLQSDTNDFDPEPYISKRRQIGFGG